MKKSDAATFYAGIKAWVVCQGYGPEIDWQSQQHIEDFDERGFLREAAWVIYCSGFRESIVRKHFDYLSLCFFDWESSAEIIVAAENCVESAMLAIGNRAKHEAVIQIAWMLQAVGFDRFKQEVLAEPARTLQTLPFIGEVTSLHLAKNLGFDFAKPDRHLVRLKDELGFSDVEDMCMHFSRSSSDSIRVVDIVLWRFMEQSGPDVLFGLCNQSESRRRFSQTRPTQAQLLETSPG